MWRYLTLSSFLINVPDYYNGKIYDVVVNNDNIGQFLLLITARKKSLTSSF